MNGFELWTKTPNTICDGARVYTKSFHFETNNRFKERLVRVYLPSTYDFDNPNKRFKTLYMFDGKNLFDDYTSYVGEWGIDETIEEFIREGSSEGYIVIGIDAPRNGRDRSREMSPSEVKRKRGYEEPQGYAHILADFVIKKVKPEIDRTFYTLVDKEHTGVGGSSSGGLMAFLMGMYYPQYFKYCLNFSPAFFLFDQKSLLEFVDKKINEELPIQYFYVGDVGFESLFVEDTFRMRDFLLDKGYKEENLIMDYDKEKEHNEYAWRIHFPGALKSADR